MKYVKFWILEELESFLEPQKTLITIPSYLILSLSCGLGWRGSTKETSIQVATTKRLRTDANYNIDDSENSMSVRLERLLRLMEADDMVKMTKICHYCGATSLYRRVRKGGYHCNICKQTFDHPTIEKIGRVLLSLFLIGQYFIDNPKVVFLIMTLFRSHSIEFFFVGFSFSFFLCGAHYFILVMRR
jgi:hypothetical protein